jgi:transcription initiation factor IIE alpha subunit
MCGSRKTYTRKNGWQDWRIYKNGFLCSKCNRHLKYVQTGK